MWGMMVKKSDKAHSERDDNLCPSCNRPYYYMPPKSVESKKYKGIPVWTWALIIVIIVMVVISITVVYAIVNLFDSSDREENYSFEVILAEGGHYKYTIDRYWNDETEISLDISSAGGEKFDVYIMDTDQYDNTYGIYNHENENVTMAAFAAIYIKEDISELSDDTIIQGGWDGLYLIIDNMDAELTKNDAVPEGTITVSVELTVVTTFFID
jgi:hypothetical protein